VAAVSVVRIALAARSSGSCVIIRSRRGALSVLQELENLAVGEDAQGHLAPGVLDADGERGSRRRLLSARLPSVRPTSADGAGMASIERAGRASWAGFAPCSGG
jgi:hypothetical protein